MEGAMLNLPGRLEDLVRRHGSKLPKGAEEEIPLIKQDLEKIISVLHGHSEPKLEGQAMVVRCWMKEVRELSYDIEDCIDHYEHAGSWNESTIRRRKLSRPRGSKNTWVVSEKLKRRLWMANKLREFSTRGQEALKCLHRYNNLGAIVGKAPTTTTTTTNWHLRDEHADNVQSVGMDTTEDILDELFKVRELVAGINFHTSSPVQINTVMEAVLNRLNKISPGTTTASTSSTSSRQQHTQFSGSANYIHHVGIDAAMNKIEDWLTDGEQYKNLKVVSIVGVGGIGKTTLANEVYRKLRRRFECRAFVRTSHKTDMRMLLVSILSQVRPNQRPDNWEVHSLISSIRTHLQDKRYLIIIDDLWATYTWDIIKCALPDGSNSSRILTTTEIEDLALQSCSYDLKFVFKMKPFGEDDSRKLFFSIVSGSHSKCPPEVYDIVRKCGGLPLAIVVIASLLASQREKQEQWDYINRSLCYSLIANPNLEGMKQLLNLCYNNLPQHLKACMLYLSMYQEDTIIWKDDLMNQWIAEGFICAIEEHDKEEISRACFDELVARKIIQPVHIDDNGEVLSCVVHHMVLNFITYKSIEENFIIAIDNSQATARYADKVRRLSVHFGNVEDATPPTNMRLSQVRTVASFGVLKCMPFIMEFRLLKVLVLHLLGDEDGITSFDLTKISELVRLRYLKVTANVTLKLPTKMRGLQYLETLKIDGKIDAVPSDIIHLPGLLHLNLPAETKLPYGIVQMASLRTLGYFDLSCNSTENLWSLGELINLWDLQLNYSAINSDNVKNDMLCLGFILGKLRNLKSITISPSGSSNANALHIDNATSMRISVDGWSSMFSPPALLQRFELLPCVCIFYNLPNWIGQLGNLCILKIGIREVTCDDVDVLGGLPALTVLSLYVHTKPEERIVFVGFSVLKYLKWSCSVAWMKFVVGAMPNLRKLKLVFDVHRADEHDNSVPVGIEHLSGLEEMSAKIRVARAADDRFVESALTNAIRMHPGRLRVNIRCVESDDGQDDDNVRAREEEEEEEEEEQGSTTRQKEHHVLVKESSSESTCAVVQEDPTSTMFSRAGSSSSSSSSGAKTLAGGGSWLSHLERYESQKRRDWDTFGQYLQNHRPPLSLSRCSGAHVVEFLKYLDQFGKTRVHTPVCSFYYHRNSLGPCSCPLSQASGYLDALVGRLLAAYEENGGTPKNTNPFAARAVRIYLREVREAQARARGIGYEKKRRKPSSDSSAGARASTTARIPSPP